MEEKTRLTDAGGWPSTLLNPLKCSDQHRWAKDSSSPGHPVVLTITVHLLSPGPETTQFGEVTRKEVMKQPCFTGSICNLIMPLCLLYCAVNTASAQLLGLLTGDQTANGALRRLGLTDALAAINLTNVLAQAEG